MISHISSALIEFKFTHLYFINKEQLMQCNFQQLPISVITIVICFQKPSTILSFQSIKFLIIFIISIFTNYVIIYILLYLQFHKSIMEMKQYLAHNGQFQFFQFQLLLISRGIKDALTVSILHSVVLPRSG